LIRMFERNETKFAPHKALKLIARGKLTFDERVLLHRVGVQMVAPVPNPHPVQSTVG